MAVMFGFFASDILDSVPNQAVTVTEVPVEEIEYFGFGPDSITPIYSARFVAAADARLHKDELVLGVSIDGESRAYPVWILRIREIVNDTVGGIPFLVTW